MGVGRDTPPYCSDLAGAWSGTLGGWSGWPGGAGPRVEAVGDVDRRRAPAPGTRRRAGVMGGRSRKGGDEPRHPRVVGAVEGEPAAPKPTRPTGLDRSAHGVVIHLRPPGRLKARAARRLLACRRAGVEAIEHSPAGARGRGRRAAGGRVGPGRSRTRRGAESARCSLVRDLELSSLGVGAAVHAGNPRPHRRCLVAGSISSPSLVCAVVACGVGPETGRRRHWSTPRRRPWRRTTRSEAEVGGGAIMRLRPAALAPLDRVGGTSWTGVP